MALNQLRAITKSSVALNLVVVRELEFRVKYGKMSGVVTWLNFGGSVLVFFITGSLNILILAVMC